MTAFVFNEINFDNHEQVVFASEEKSGLKAIIAIHNTHLGPAMGGCRMWNYASEAEAVRDVLRLSRGMTYKNAVAGLPIGGGKSVIIGNPKARPPIPAIIPISKSSWWVGVKTGRYPKPIKLGPRTTAWTASSIRHLIENLNQVDQGGTDRAKFTAIELAGQA